MFVPESETNPSLEFLVSAAYTLLQYSRQDHRGRTWDNFAFRVGCRVSVRSWLRPVRRFLAEFVEYFMGAQCKQLAEIEPPRQHFAHEDQ